MPRTCYPDLSSLPGELAKVGAALSTATDRFGREISGAAATKLGRRPRARRPARLPASPTGRPLPHPLILPKSAHHDAATTVLDQRRRAEAVVRGGPLPVAAAVEAGAERVADVVRGRLLSLRRVLGAIRDRFGRRRR